MDGIGRLMESYRARMEEIGERLSEFKGILEGSDEKVFAELCFCICTPQSKATACWEAISSLVENDLLFYGSEDEIRPFLGRVVFAEAKAGYIVKARRLFTRDGELRVKERMEAFNDIFKLRGWLVKNVKGIGLKEASHFLRNIGLGSNLAILDRHIIRSLVRLGVIEENPKTLTRKAYLLIEAEMREFSRRIGISMGELDLLLWSEETGMVFK